MTKVASGIFMWDGHERRSGRYGYVYMSNTNFSGTVRSAVWLDEEAARALDGKQVKLVARVVGARQSGHAGDAFLGLRPSMPEVGEEIVVGVGTLRLGTSQYGMSFGLVPGDARAGLWLDPRKLYRLHDQSVELHAEETGEPDSVVEPFPEVEDGAISNGDGTFQVRRAGRDVGGMRIMTKVERIGNGVFVMGGKYAEGERLDVAFE